MKHIAIFLLVLSALLGFAGMVTIAVNASNQTHTLRIVGVQPGEPDSKYFVLRSTYTVLERDDGVRVIVPGALGDTGETVTMHRRPAHALYW